MIPMIKFSLTVEAWSGMTPEQVREQFTQAADAMIERMRLEQAYRERYLQDITVEVEGVDSPSGDINLNQFGFYKPNFSGDGAIVTAFSAPPDDSE